jgi:hypothetical protein
MPIENMTDSDPTIQPECFGDLDRVFPPGADGLRHTPSECLACKVKTDCLRAAVTGEQGLAVHEERLARAYRAGSVGFLNRWAEQKKIERLKKRSSRWRDVFKRRRRAGT